MHVHIDLLEIFCILWLIEAFVPLSSQDISLHADLCIQIFPYYKDTSNSELGLTLMTSS